MINAARYADDKAAVSVPSGFRLCRKFFYWVVGTCEELTATRYELLHTIILQTMYAPLAEQTRCSAIAERSSCRVR